jgi:hypothetical protein
MLEVSVSVAERDWVPAVHRVTLKDYAPLLDAVKVESAGNVAALSELVKWTVPV